VVDERLYMGHTIGIEMDQRTSIDIDSSEDLAIAECLMKLPVNDTRG
jgi:CMP-N-acetylneuraminic acid synthetase